MTLLFMEGFDHIDNGDTSRKWDSNASFSIHADYARFPGTNKQGASLSNSNISLANYTVGRILPSSETFIFGMAFKIAGTLAPGINSTEVWFRFDDGWDGVPAASFRQVAIILNPDYTISAVKGIDGTTVLGTSSNSFEREVWYYLEIKIKFHISAGEVTLRVNEVEEFAVTGVITSQTGNAYANTLIINCPYNDIAMRYDDIYVCDGLGTENNDFLGECVVDTLRPDGDGSSSDWTPSAGANYQNVDDAVAVDDDATYNSSATVGDKDLYTLSGLTNTGVSIKGIQLATTMRKDDATAFSVKPIIRTNSIDYQQAESVLEDEYNHSTLNILELNPNDSQVWEEADINALESGVVVVTPS